MKQNHIRQSIDTATRGLYMVVLLLLSAHTAFAYDFEITTQTGQKLYFSQVDGGVEVVHPNTAPDAVLGWKDFNKPTGALEIPSSISVDGVEYDVLSIGNYAFYQCTQLTSISIGEGVLSIGIGAFQECKLVTSITLPQSITTLGNICFRQLSALTTLTIGATTPPTTTQYTFYDTDLDGCTLLVPCGSLSNYDSAPWSDFGTVSSVSCMYSVVAVPSNDKLGVVTGSGTYEAGALVTLTATALPIAEFVGWDDGVDDNPRTFTATADVQLVALFVSIEADTVWLHDTLTVEVHDTLVLHDTVHVVTVLHDTVPQFDTVHVVTVLHDTVPLFDTIYVPAFVHDTLWQHDTVTVVQVVHDTIVPTYFNVSIQTDHATLGVGVGSGDFAAGTVVEVCGLPIEGGRFVAWSDGETANPRRLTVLGKTQLTALFEQVNITSVEEWGYTLATSGRDIVLQGADGQPVRIYDLGGRLLHQCDNPTGQLHLRMPAAGCYLVQVGLSAPARRVVLQ